MVCDHREVEVVFVSIIESEIYGVGQGRDRSVSQVCSQALLGIRGDTR